MTYIYIFYIHTVTMFAIYFIYISLYLCILVSCAHIFFPIILLYCIVLRYHWYTRLCIYVLCILYTAPESIVVWRWINKQKYYIKKSRGKIRIVPRYMILRRITT